MAGVFGDSKRSTAAQFFMEEEEESGADDKPTHDRVVELLNQASLLQKDQAKVTHLRQVQELILNKDPNLLDSFLEEVIAFQSDRSQDVRKFVVGFIEEACKKDPEILHKVVSSLSVMLSGDLVAVTKKVILSMANIYKAALQWMAETKTVTEEMKGAWKYIVQMKDRIVDMLDSENDGVRTHSVKFVESLVITLSRKTPDSDIPKKNRNDISLDKIPENTQGLRLRKLEDEGQSAFDQMLQFLASPHISSVNLMTCMGSLSVISKQRPKYMTRVIQGFETLHVNLPPTLATSQVSSVRKNLKMQMLGLLKHPASVDAHTQITTLLTDLGATQTEVMRAMPKVDPSKKRKAAEMAPPSSKKPHIAPPADIDDDDISTPFVGSSSKSATEAQRKTAIDVTASDLVTKLTPQNVADLVLLTMVMLPDNMPPAFQATYTPIAAAGTTAQIKHLSRLLSMQLTAAGLGKGMLDVTSDGKEVKKDDDITSPEYQPSSPHHTIQTVVGGSVTTIQPKEETIVPLPQPQPQLRKGVKQFKLAAVTKQLNSVDMDALAHDAIMRILKAEKAATLGDVSTARVKILTSLVTMFGGAFKDVLQNFIFNDLRNRGELALAWIYQEYSMYQRFTLASGDMDKQNIASYDECLTRLLNGLLERPDHKEGLFSRLILEAPHITPNAIQVLRKYCQEESRIYLGMSTLKELILKRPTRRLEFLDVLLEFGSSDKPDVRNNAIRVTKKLHERPDLEVPIERYAAHNLKMLLHPAPPTELVQGGRYKGEEAWREETIKLCLYLYLALLPINHRLIHELATVYTATSADIKRTILRVIENPVKGMGMQSPELLTLVENCPKGAETLVTRIIHILTDKAAPSAELVRKVRDLYQKRVSDVRFLIPVLTGLSKHEVMAALPKLIKLNPVVVKEVFNRLLGIHGGESYVSPLTPVELLNALHNIDQSKCDMKTVIKALNMCFIERGIYTQEVLAVVIQQLMDQTPLPTLLMRTVIQSLSMYPKLIGFVLNVMQRLITKQVWKNKKVWEGFVKCCQRTKPQSFQVLLQLPAAQLKSVFEISPDLREPLLGHVQSFTPHQRAHIPKPIMTILEKDPEEEAAEKAKKEEEKLAAQDKLYQQKLEEERRKQQKQPKEESEGTGTEEEEGQKIVTLTPSSTPQRSSRRDSEGKSPKSKA